LLRYPYYGHARASYLLIGMVPVCAFGAAGLDLLTRSSCAAGILLAVLVGAWACTAYASFWIDPDAAVTPNWAGNHHMHAGRYDAALLCFRNALRADPHSIPARLNMARMLLEVGQTAESHRLVDGILHDEPNDPDVLLVLAHVYGAEGQLDAAVESL